MTWSISASGTKEEAKAQIKEALCGCAGAAERAVFEAAQGFMLAQVDAMETPRVSASASGSASGGTNYASLSISGS